RPWCTDDHVELLGWDDEGVLVRGYGPGDPVAQVVDPDGGTVLDTRAALDGTRTPPTADAITSSRRTSTGDELEVRSVDGDLLWRVDAPNGYEVTGGWANPGGDVVALVDSADRLLLVPADGAAEPRIWAEDVTSWS